MHLLTALSLTGIVAVALSASVRSSDDEMIDHINNLEGNTWKAGKNFDAEEEERIINGLGLDLEANALYNKLHLSNPEIVYPEADPPKNFDSRQQWPKCDTMKDIRDQSNCGSCWAFGAVEAMSDRNCVTNGGNVRLSANDVLSCCEDCAATPGEGCKGGYPAAAYAYWVSDGVVTGGQWGSKQGCYPYEIKPNGTGLAPTPKCHKSCEEGYPKTYAQDKHFGSKYYQIQAVDDMMKDLVTNGPITAGFAVYKDFMAYKSGVYKHVGGGKPIGAHAIKIIGYGTENGQDYWLVANSWSPRWGEKGYFKIAKGTNECQIESYVIAGIPKKE